MRIVWQTVRRITNEILGVKGSTLRHEWPSLRDANERKVCEGSGARTLRLFLRAHITR